MRCAIKKERFFLFTITLSMDYLKEWHSFQTKWNDTLWPPSKYMWFNYPYKKVQIAKPCNFTEIEITVCSICEGWWYVNQPATIASSLTRYFSHVIPLVVISTLLNEIFLHIFWWGLLLLKTYAILEKIILIVSELMLIGLQLVWLLIWLSGIFLAIFKMAIRMLALSLLTLYSS